MKAINLGQVFEKYKGMWGNYSGGVAKSDRMIARCREEHLNPREEK